MFGWSGGIGCIAVTGAVWLVQYLCRTSIVELKPTGYLFGLAPNKKIYIFKCIPRAGAYFLGLKIRLGSATLSRTIVLYG